MPFDLSPHCRPPSPLAPSLLWPFDPRRRYRPGCCVGGTWPHTPDLFFSCCLPSLVHSLHHVTLIHDRRGRPGPISWPDLAWLFSLICAENCSSLSVFCPSVRMPVCLVVLSCVRMFHATIPSFSFFNSYNIFLVLWLVILRLSLSKCTVMFFFFNFLIFSIIVNV